MSSGTPPIYHILEKYTGTFSSYLSLKRNPVFGASAQRISRPSYTAVVALTATCDGRSKIWRKRHFSASGVSDFGKFLKGLPGTIWPIRRARDGTESPSTE